MKTNKIIYWVSTGIISAMMLFSAFGYFTNPDMKAGFVHLGFPDFFRIELGVAKILGAIALLLPMPPAKIKEWAYFGFALVFLSASIGHAAVGDPVGNIIPPLVFLAILGVSYFYNMKVKA